MAIEFFEFVPLFVEDEEDIRARLDSDVNQGIDPNSSEYTDTRQGGMFYTLTQPGVMEKARIWDAASIEVPAAAFVGMAWGEYLDYHAADLGLERKEAVKATGEALFTGVAGTLVPSDLRLSAVQVNPDVDAPEYRTTESGVISTALATPTGLAATGATTSGNLPAGTYYYVVTAINEYGETLESTEQSATIGATGQVSLNWNDVAGASGYRVYRSTSSGNNKFLTEVVNSEHVDVGADAPTTADPPTANGTGSKFRASIEALTEGAEGNVGAGAIDTILTPLVGVDAVTNELAISGGADIESDEDLRERLLLEFQGGGPGNVADYERWALAYPGVGRATIVPVASGPGTVTVIIMDVEGNPVSQAVIDGLQAQLDPLPGQGAGTAPIGATVTVTTPASVLIDIVATVDFEDGYTLDGAGGTVALRDRITEALSHYIDGLEAGEDVVFDHVKAQFYTVPGVYKVTALTVEGGSADVSITATPPQIATLGVVTLSE